MSGGTVARNRHQMPGKHHRTGLRAEADSTGAIMPVTSMAVLVTTAFSADSGVNPPTGFFGAMADAATWFIGLFQAGGDFFLGLVTGIIPLLIVLLTAINALIRWIGPERIDKVGELAARPGIQYYPVRYLVLPF